MSGLFAQSSPDLDAEARHFVHVAVERGMDRAKGGGAGGGGGWLTYRSAEPIGLGRRVEVPLGRTGKLAAGIVIRSGGRELADGLAMGRIKSVIRDAGSGLPPRLIDLARWIAGYYICPLGMVLSSMLPAAVKKRTGVRTRARIDRVPPETEAPLAELKLPKGARRAWEAVVALGRESFPLSPADLASRTGERSLASINRLVRVGLLRLVEDEDVRAFGSLPGQEIVEQFDPDAPASFRHELNAAQSRVVAGVGETLGSFRVHLLRGVTGSGKTEVYLQLIERVLESGRRGMVLVPEISLTPQTAGRFARRFEKSGVAILHSGLSASQRHREWARASSGAARVIVGARSAVFAPIENLGLIVVDEEHAPDYKQDQLPRYHGRDVAIKRAQFEGCPVLLGSATPSLESWSNAAAAGGKFSLWELTDRVGGGTLPKVEVVDLAEERRIRARMLAADGWKDKRQHLLGPTLEAAIHETLEAEGQVILLLNRRGYSGHIACPDPNCGFVLGCDDCDAHLVYHKVVRGDGHDDSVPARAIVRCHHCLQSTLLPQVCPLCGKKLFILAQGTQRLEEEMLAKFGPYLVGKDADSPALVRVDSDTMKSGRDYYAVLARFARGQVRVLMGTQMIAKGLDFPNVRLVGVVNADTALSLPDFRASERTFQLVSQVSGRTGRGSRPGRVVVQTFDPDAPAIRLAATHDFRAFAAGELADRQRSGLPPVTRMARIVCRDKEYPKAERHAREVAEAIRQAAEVRTEPARKRELRIVGPAPCVIARIGGFHRIGIELTAPTRGLIQDVLGAVRERGILKSDSRTAVDVDPISLM